MNKRVYDARANETAVTAQDIASPMTFKEQCTLVTDIAFTIGVLEGIATPGSWTHNTKAAVKEAHERMMRTLDTIKKLPVTVA